MKRNQNQVDTPAQELRKALFYAKAEAGMYDSSIRKVVPQYSLAHRSLMHLAANHLTLGDKLDFRSVRGAVLDIGAGTGQEAIPLLETFPHIQLVAVDLSEPILRVLKRKLSRRPNATGRSTILHADFLSETCSPSNLMAAIASQDRSAKYKLVISALALHHFAHTEKQAAFNRIYEILGEGGLFLNLDLFSFESKTLARESLDFDLKWISRSFGIGDGRPKKAGLGEDLGRLWIKHYLEENIAEPFEGDACEGQQSMLKAAGFSEVGMPYRYFQVGISWAKR